MITATIKFIIKLIILLSILHTWTMSWNQLKTSIANTLTIHPQVNKKITLKIYPIVRHRSFTYATRKDSRY